jgi:esterase/lipase superfamily enzyme
MRFLLKTLAIFPLIFLLAIFTLVAEQSDQVGLYTITNPDGVRVQQLGTVLDQALERMDKSGRYRDIVFFVHGRGKHPAKGMKIMPEFEQKYDLEVLMFHWPSWLGATKRPVAHAQAAALQLKQLFHLLENYQARRQNWLDEHQIRFTLFCHSMGNIVMQEYLKSHHRAGALPSDLFDNVVFNAADVALKNHHTWMDQIDFTERTYVTINRYDIILAGSKAIDLINGKFSGRRLGHAKSGGFKQGTLTNKVSYLDLSKVAGNQHRYYLMHKNPDVNYFFGTVFHGKEAELTTEQGVYPRKKKKKFGRFLASIFSNDDDDQDEIIPGVYEFRK